MYDKITINGWSRIIIISTGIVDLNCALKVVGLEQVMVRLCGFTPGNTTLNTWDTEAQSE